MPPGTVTDPSTNDAAPKTGYLLRYDLLDHEGKPSKIPVLNAQKLEKNLSVVFDVVKFDVKYGGENYYIPIAVIPDALLEYINDKDEQTILADSEGEWNAVKQKINWENEWGKADSNLLDIDQIDKIKKGEQFKVKKKN